jgi:hypothetical protein
LLLTNPRRIEQGEHGNLAFGVHRSTDNPKEFWLYEIWVDEAAVQAHERGDTWRVDIAPRPSSPLRSLALGRDAG